MIVSMNAASGEPGLIDWEAGGIETELGWSLTVTLQNFAAAGLVALVDVPGGPRGYQVLVAITTEAPTSQLALGQRLGIDKNAMTAVVDELEAAGYVKRKQDAKDRRIRQVLPTPAARGVLAAAREALSTVEQALMQPLTMTEQTQLRRLLARVALGSVNISSPSTLMAENSNTPAGEPFRSDRRTHNTAPNQNRNDEEAKP